MEVKGWPTVEELPGYLPARRAWIEMVGEFRRDGQ